MDEYFASYLSALDRAASMLDEPDWLLAKPFLSAAKTLPEVFSRLCYRCSPRYRWDLFDTLRVIYGSSRRSEFAEVDKFVRRLLDSMSLAERIRAVPALLKFPPPENPGEIDRHRFVNPILLLEIPDSVSGARLPIPAGWTQRLLERLESGGSTRDWAASSLAWLHVKRKLNVSETERFGVQLWEGIADDSVPTVPGFYSAVFKTLPHPAGIYPTSRVKSQLRSRLVDSLGDSRVDEVLRELSHSGSSDWSVAEALEILEALAGWCARNSYRLNDQTPTPFGGSLADMTRRTVTHIVTALTQVFSQVSVDEGSGDALHEFMSELREQRIPATRLAAAVL